MNWRLINSWFTIKMLRLVFYNNKLRGNLVKILSKLIALLALVSLSQVCLAADPVEKKPEMKMDHAMPGMDEAKMTEHLKMRQEQILKMHDLSNKILAETDPKKKQALKDEQLELIKAEHMQMMSMHHQKMMNMSK
jgi:hypothetical protein